MSVAKILSDRTARISDRLLERFAPKMTAEAVCGGWAYCCGWNGPRWERGMWRRDPEHNGQCTPCYAINELC